MKILITGNRGFVGTETQKLLEESGHKVIGYDLMEGFDICDSQQLERVVLESRPDRILHLAAIARFADADSNPKLAFETNFFGTANVANIAKKYHIPLVYSSTGSVYMPITDFTGTIKETWTAKGNSVYGCTKYAGETYVRENNPYIILRYAHLYGALKVKHGLIGGYLSRIERGMAPTLYSGKQSNDFTYIKDIARANYLALTAPWSSWNEIYNIGTGEELSALDAGQIVIDGWNETFPDKKWQGEVEVKEGRTVDPERFWFDCSKAEIGLGFKAQYSFKEGMIDLFKELRYTVGNGKTNSTGQERKIHS